MFDRLKQVLSRSTSTTDTFEQLKGDAGSAGLDVWKAWANRAAAAAEGLPDGGVMLTGEVAGHTWRGLCTQSSRAYIRGLELAVRGELALKTSSTVVVMTRLLKAVLERQSNELYARYTDDLRTTTDPLPEEVGWLSMYPEMQLPSMTQDFLARYAVLGNDGAAATDWLKEPLQKQLLSVQGEGSMGGRDRPVLLMLMRGKTYLRMQVNGEEDTMHAFAGLELFLQASERAATCFSSRV